MTETDTNREDYGLYDGRCVSGCQHHHGGEILHHHDCGHYPDSLTKVNADKIASLLARAEKAEVSLSQMRDSVAEIEGFSEYWPTHGNIPLAIVAGYSLHKSGREEAEAARDAAWNDALEAAASMVESDYFETACEAAEQIRALRKGEPT